MRVLLVAVAGALLLTACSPSAAETSLPVPSAPTTSATSPQASPAPDLAPPSPPTVPPAAEPVRKTNKAAWQSPERTSKVGIGTPLVVTFKRPVKSDSARQAIADATVVTANGGVVPGGWWWPSSTEAHFRPLDYWPGSSEISFSLDMSGLDLGKYVGKDQVLTHNFRTSAPWHLVVNGKDQSMKVYKGEKLVKTLGVSLGKEGYRTRNGVKVIMTHQNDYTMRGTDENGPYEITVDTAMRITNTGEFIHSAPWAAGRIGQYPGSHGCTNLHTSDAAWLMDTVPIGTPVKFKNTGGTGTDPSNGVGDWNVKDKDLYLTPAVKAEAQIPPAAGF